MISLVPIEKSELRKYIAIGFGGDEELFSEFHVSPGTQEHCIDHTMNFISDQFLEHDVNFYKVAYLAHNDYFEIGYTATVHNEKKPHELYSFAINKTYRKEHILKEWLKRVAELLGEPYYTALHDVNTRAIAFFKKNGFEVVDKSGFKLLFKERTYDTSLAV